MTKDIKEREQGNLAGVENSLFKTKADQLFKSDATLLKDLALSQAKKEIGGQMRTAELLKK